MLWLLYALAGAALYGFTPLVDKVVLSRYLKNPWTCLRWWGVSSLFVSMLFLLFSGVPRFDYYAVLAGILQAAGTVFYVRAIAEDDASRVVPFALLSPLFVLALAALTLREMPTNVQLSGCIILVAGSVAMGVRETKGFAPTRGELLATIYAAFIGASLVSAKAALGSITPVEYLFWAWLSYGAFALVLTRGGFREVAGAVGSMDWRGKALLALGVLTFLSNSILGTYAYSLQYVSLVAAVGASQAVFVLTYVLIAGAFVPRLIKEELGNGRLLALKVAGGILIMLGVYLVS